MSLHLAAAAGPAASLATCRSGRWLARIDRLPPTAWLALLAAALWPHWRWAAARMRDGSDDPLGLAALGALAVFVLREGGRMRARPDGRWLAASAVAAALATAAAAAIVPLPPLAGAAGAALAVAFAARAFLPAGQAVLPLAGLAVLALPVLSSLQFYAGFPLRVLTAELSTHLLRLGGLAAERAGASMLVEGRLIVVDAPCSGVQMVWMAYFAAFSVAAWQRTGDRAVLRRLPALGALVMAGNVVRNAVLVGLEGQGHAVSPAMHEAIGLVVLALVCAGVVTAMRRAVS